MSYITNNKKADIPIIIPEKLNFRTRNYTWRKIFQGLKREIN